MSERGFSETLVSGLLATALLATAPAAAVASGDCNAMSPNFVICADGSPWAEARWVQFGDGAAIELAPYWLEFAEHWVTGQDEAPLEAALDDLLREMLAAEAEEGMAPPEPLLRDRFETGHLSVERIVQLIDMGDGTREMMAIMIAESTFARIALMLGIDTEITADDFARSARDLAELIRPGQEG